jgi:cytochrome o ubiquinol oxidase operon protein cyoD
MSDSRQEADRGTIWTYVLGFGLSLALTLTAYFAVKHHINTRHIFPRDNVMIAILAALAVAQLFAQLVFFLHLNRESKPRWNLLVFLFMLMVLVIVVAGSLWIMNNLNYHMSSQQDSQYLKDQESGGL